VAFFKGVEEAVASLLKLRSDDFSYYEKLTDLPARKRRAVMSTLRRKTVRASKRNRK
jgi:hypothetical protein